MGRSNILYVNLRAEMGRKNITIKDMANICGYNRDSLARKLSKKTPINLAEAFQSQEKVFPDKDIYYLFDLNGEYPRGGYLFGNRIPDFPDNGNRIGD